MHLAPIEAGTATTTQIGVVHESGISARMEPSMRDEDWFILRTAGRSTLTLARTLNEDGFEAWTPVREETIRVPRMNVRRKINLPMLPSFVFVRRRHLVDMLDLAKRPLRHKGFSVFRYLDQIPMVSDRHLEPLRTKESEAVPRKQRPSFQKGDSVRVKTGPFQGLFGRVERCKSGYALVIFDDWRNPVQIPTFLLGGNGLASASNVAIAA